MHTSDTRRSGYGLSRYKVKRLFSNLKIICNADKDIFHTQLDSRCHTTIPYRRNDQIAFVWKRSLKVLETKNSKDKMLSDLVLFKP